MLTLLPRGLAARSATALMASCAAALLLRRREKKPPALPLPRGGDAGFLTPRGGDGGGDLPAGVLCWPARIDMWRSMRREAFAGLRAQTRNDTTAGMWSSSMQPPSVGQATHRRPLV